MPTIYTLSCRICGSKQGTFESNKRAPNDTDRDIICSKPECHEEYDKRHRRPMVTSKYALLEEELAKAGMPQGQARLIVEALKARG